MRHPFVLVAANKENVKVGMQECLTCTSTSALNSLDSCWMEVLS